MSGTSLDGVDAVLARFNPDTRPQLLRTHYLPYDDTLRARLLALHHAQPDELHVAACLANDLARLYAQAVNTLTEHFDSEPIHAIGCHGQTVRHRPDCGYTLQLGNAALLAELTGLTVVSDFRSRDLAAGGQGAPLVPAFHAEVAHHPGVHRVIVNIGGIANLTDLPPVGPVRGWDTGPGNMLMDAWIQSQHGVAYDKAGAWGASGAVQGDLLDQLMRTPYLMQPPPKSAGREQFNLDWLQTQLTRLGRTIAPADVQATLLEFTAASLARAINQACPTATEIYVCGGGAHNSALLARLRAHLPAPSIERTDALGIASDWMEAFAFAWLARQTLHHAPGNLPAVTGAHGPRILGAVTLA